jgi:hypothetical protein
MESGRKPQLCCAIYFPEREKKLSSGDSIHQELALFDKVFILSNMIKYDTFS